VPVEFDTSTTEAYLRGLREFGFISYKMYVGGDARITLEPFGVQEAEKYAMENKNFGENIANTAEVRKLLAACCLAAEYSLQTEFNHKTIGNELGFSEAKTDHAWDRLKADGFVHNPNIGTRTDPRSQITVRALSSVQGEVIPQQEGTTVNNNTLNTGDISQSNVSVGGDGVAQTLSISQNQREKYSDFITTINTLKSQLPEEVHAQLDANIRNIENQLVSDNGDAKIIDHEVGAIQRMLEGAVGSGAGSAIIETAKLLLGG